MQRLAHRPTRTLGEMTQELRDSQQASLRQQFDAEAAAFLGCGVQQDVGRASAAFLAKRPARFASR
jgi:enoyl-CoA hydratase/carnithine racemase